MGKNRFTQEDIDRLSKNVYVLKVNDKQVVFTKEFREHCLIEHSLGKTARQIFDEAQIGYQCVGKDRSNDCLRRFKQQAQRSEGFDRVKGSGRPKNPVFESVDDENKYLKEQIEYLKQENEYLKKLEALELKYSKSQRKKNIK